MKQKFRKLSFVSVCKNMPPEMVHFDSNFTAIIDGTYSQIYGGTDIDSYSLYKIEEGKVVNRISWYRESQLTLLEDQDKDKAEDMIEEYNLRRSRR